MRALHLLVLVAAFTTTACSSATGGVTGGDPITPDPCTQTGEGHTFSDLYICYFGPQGRANCSSQSFCHGSPSAFGAIGSAFVCGTTKEACWQGMTQAMAPIVPSGSSQNPSATALVESLRQGPNQPSAMPCNPVQVSATLYTCLATSGGNYTFTADDIARIDAWIAEGAEDN